jgi:hypothetical protein
MEALIYVAIAALVIYAVYLLVVYVIIPGFLIALGISLTVGALTGGGHAVYNYCVAFGNNVRRERV